jgi:prepilin-type processing-associated H-X9-DG protein
MTCSNQLKQVGLAFHNFHDARGAFPQGGYSKPGCIGADLADRREWSWCYHILPYLEQENLFRDPSAAAVGRTPVTTYYCPSRRAAALYNNGARTDYAGCAGDDPEGGNGIVRRGFLPAVRLADVTDGTANTVLAGEKRLNVARLGASADDNEVCYFSGWNGDYDHYRRARPLGAGSWEGPARDFSDPTSAAGSQNFGSSHTAGLNVVFADGSVRLVRYGVDGALFRNACVINDGQGANTGD